MSATQIQHHIFGSTWPQENFIIKYNSLQQSFEKVVNQSEIKINNWSCAVPYKDSEFLLTGGLGNTNKIISNEVYVYNTQTNQLSLLGQFTQCRYVHQCVWFNDKIYIIGGRQYGPDFESVLSHCEVFEHGHWKIISPMTKRRSNFGVFIYQDRIHCIGGFDGKKNTKSIEYYHEQKNIWIRSKVRLPRGLAGFQLIPLGNSKIMIIGGMTLQGPSQACLMLNLKNNTCMSISQTNQIRSLFHMFRDDYGNYIIYGGMNKPNTFELFNNDSKMWEEMIINCDPNAQDIINQGLRGMVSSQCLCVVDDTPIMQQNKKQYDPDDVVFLFGNDEYPFILPIPKFPTDQLEPLEVPTQLGLFSYMSVCSIDPELPNCQQILIAGGIDSKISSINKKAYLVTIIFPEMKIKIKKAGKLQYHRYAASCVYNAPYVYVIGGRGYQNDVLSLHSTVERFNVDEEQWDQIAPLNEPKCSLTANDMLVKVKFLIKLNVIMNKHQNGIFQTLNYHSHQKDSVLQLYKIQNYQLWEEKDLMEVKKKLQDSMQLIQKPIKMYLDKLLVIYNMLVHYLNQYSQIVNQYSLLVDIFMIILKLLLEKYSLLVKITNQIMLMKQIQLFYNLVQAIQQTCLAQLIEYTINIFMNQIVQSLSEIPQSQPNINYGSVKYSFKCVRRHLFKDKVYHVHALPNMLTIGENFNDPNPKYKLELNLKNTVYWKQEHGQNRAFGIKYKKNIKYFEAAAEQLLKFRQAISCMIGFHSLDDHYKIEELIGKGSFSSVYKIYRQYDKKVFAMKYVSSKQKNDKENMQLLENEISILHSFNSEQILKIHEVYRVEEYHYGIIVEYVDGICLATLIDQLKKNQNKLKEYDIKIMLQALLRALANIHSEQVIHRDIKPQNIMIQSQQYRNVKIIDFGLSIKNQLQYNRCGTPGYMAPEIVNMKKDQQKPWTSLCDVFSLGVVFFKLLSKGISCFQGQTSDQVLANNKKCSIDWSIVQPHNYSKHCITLLKAMLAKDPEERITAYQALQHPFFADLPPALNTDFNGNSMTIKSKYMMNPTTCLDNKQILDSLQSINDAPLQTQHVYSRDIRPSMQSRRY